jgi:hypothetical protein
LRKYGKGKEEVQRGSVLLVVGELTTSTLHIHHETLLLGLAELVGLLDTEISSEEGSGLFEGQTGRLGVGEVDEDEGELGESRQSRSRTVGGGRKTYEAESTEETVGSSGSKALEHGEEGGTNDEVTGLQRKQSQQT